MLSLDLSQQQVVSELIDRRRREANTAVLFVTHEINPILAYVDRVLYLVGGQWAIGTPEEVLTSERLSALYGTTVDVRRGARAHRGHRRRGTRASPARSRGASLVTGVNLYLSQPFAQHALIAGALVAITCGLIGPFVVTRRMAFAVHGTSELAFTGAAGGTRRRRQRARRRVGRALWSWRR